MRTLYRSNVLDISCSLDPTNNSKPIDPDFREIFDQLCPFNWLKNSWKFRMHSFGIDYLFRWARYKTANTRSNIDDFILILNLHIFKDFNMHFLLGRCDCATSCNTKTFAANVATSSTQDPRSSDQCSWQKQKNTIALGMYNIKNYGVLRPAN